MLIATVDDSYVDLASIGLFLPEEVVHPSLNVVAQTSGWQAFGRESILFALRITPFVAIITDKSTNQTEFNHLVMMDGRHFLSLKFQNYP